MLTKEQIAGIRRLREQGLSISQIAKEKNLDWKTAKKYSVQDQGNGKNNIESKGKQNNPGVENELEKSIFEKLNAGISPRDIVAQLGHVDLVTDLHKRWQALDRNISENLDLPDPKIEVSWNAWEESFEKYFEWHQKRAIKALAGFAWVRMGSCANFVNNNVECPQIDKVKDPYKCISCCCHSPYNF